MIQSKLAAPFEFKNKFNDTIGQFNINYTPGVNSASKLFEFLEMYSDRFINIAFPKDVKYEDIQQFTTFENWRVRITKVSEFNQIDELVKHGIKFFFDEKFCATNWQQLRDQISLGCCQIYVSDDLTHRLDLVYNRCQEHGVGIRCVLNHVHSSGRYRGLNPTDWFIRPEDMDFIEPYYDAFEFDCSYDNADDKYEWNKFEALYHVFFETKKYIGNLMEINWQLGFYFANPYYPPQYGSRCFCGGHCLQGSSCKICQRYQELARVFEEKGYIFTIDKKGEENG